MSEFKWFSLDIPAFLADTMRLNTECKGAYFMLLLDYYQHAGGCLAEDHVIEAITKWSPERWAQYKPSIMEYFEIRDGRLWQARCEEEIAKAREIMAKTKAARAQQSEAGRISAAKRWSKRDPQRPLQRPLEPRTGDGLPAEPTIATEPSIDATNVPNSNGRYNEPDNDRSSSRDAYYLQSNSSKEESSLRELKKKAAEAIASATPAAPLHIPLPSDFELSDEDMAHCKADGADPPWVLGVFRPWKQYHLDAGTLTTDWKAAWWRRWDKAKPPAEPEPPPKPKPRLVVSAGKASVKTKLPDDWQPNANNALVCAEEGYDLDAMAEHFRNVCGANGYRYVNHHLAFTNFIRNQKNFTRGNHNAKTSARGSIVESGYRSGRHLDAQIREAEEAEALARGSVEAVRKLSED